MVARLKVDKFNAVAATQSIRIVWGKERLCALIRGIDEGVVGVDAPARRAVVELGLNALPQRLSGVLEEAEILHPNRARHLHDVVVGHGPERAEAPRQLPAPHVLSHYASLPLSSKSCSSRLRSCGARE
jgi:hypothetical protein